MFLKAAKRLGLCISMYGLPDGTALAIVADLTTPKVFERVTFPSRGKMRAWVDMFRKAKDSYR